MAVLTLKFDESYKARSFLIGGWIGNDKQWRRREKLWQKAIAFENRTLPEGRKISRYHGSEMNAYDGEFKGWKQDPKRGLRFTKKLLNISGKSGMIPVAVGIDLTAFDEIFPLRELPSVGNAYVLCMKALMQQLGEALAKYQPDDRLAIIHDHSEWDVPALQGYNQAISEVGWPDRHRFVSITSLTWRQDIGLQSADLFAYESMRYLEDHRWTGEDMRPALRELFRLINRPAFGFLIGRKYLELMREQFEKDGKFDPLKPVPIGF